MEKEIRGKQALFTAPEIDLILCALLRYSTELRSRSRLMERFASAEHLEKHRAKIALGEKLLEEFSL